MVATDLVRFIPDREGIHMVDATSIGRTFIKITPSPVSMPFIDQKELFEKTDGGRLVIEQYYPQSVKAFTNPNYKFKCRTAEKTASSSVKRMPDGVWVVTDFGDDSKPRNCIQVVMHEEGIEFKAAIDLIAAQFNIVPEEKRKEVYKPEIRRRKAKKGEKDGTYSFETKDFTVKEIRTILAPKVWEYLVAQISKSTDAEKIEAAVLAEVSKVFKRYNFYSLKSHTTIKNSEAITVSSTDIYPIFMFDLGDWQKIYKPREVMASYRFMYAGEKPTDYVFGLEYAQKCYKEISTIEDGEEADGESFKKIGPTKLNSITIVSGGSDGLNLACIGQCFKVKGKAKETPEMLAENFYPVWLNSETALLNKGVYKNLATIAKTVYNLPDIDTTGKKQAHKLALQYLELKTIYLPEELKAKTDSFRKKAMKDLRDYFRYYTPYDFFTLLRTAYPYRFWDAVPPTEKKDKWTYNVNNKHLYNFLARNGFYRYESESEKEGYFYIQIAGNIVRRIEPKKIRDFINQFIEAEYPDVELMNTFLRTNQLNEASLSNLPFIKIDFTDYDKETQWMFYADAAAEIKADGIKVYKAGDADKYVWEDEVIPHNIITDRRNPAPLPDFFTVTECYDIETKERTYGLNIHNQDCLVFRYLINTSRINWREELETRLEGVPAEDREEYAQTHRFTKYDMHLLDGLPTEADREAYATDNRWNIAGPLLTPREKHGQELQLINKLFAIGYQFHRHREAGKSWCLWGMDAKLSDDGNTSHGGSGKSLLPNLIHSQKLMKAQYREGRNHRLTDNPHFWEGTDRHTDLMLIDDCHRYMKFDFFFSAIGGPITVNPKNNKQYTINSNETPKIWFTSNFPPIDADVSTDRRIIYMLYSDYYHYSRMGEYREDRSVLDEFGKNFGNEFTEREWQLFLNLIMQCIKFYLNCTEKINPPMEFVNKRSLKSSMGDLFEPWANVYFSEEGGKLDIAIVRDEAQTDYIRSTNQKNINSKIFSKSLKAWCAFQGYELNPKELSGKDGRIIKRVDVADGNGGTINKTVEMIYIKTKAVMAGVFDRYKKRQAANQEPKKETEDECPI